MRSIVWARHSACPSPRSHRLKKEGASFAHPFVPGRSCLWIARCRSSATRPVLPATLAISTRCGETVLQTPIGRITTLGLNVGYADRCDFDLTATRLVLPSGNHVHVCDHHGRPRLVDTGWP